MIRRFLVPALVLALAAPAIAQTTLNVRDADIRAFIADAAKVTGRTFIIDNRVQGKVTVVTDRPLSRSEYLEVFLSTLRANGLVAVPTGNGAFRVQPIDNAASQPGRIGTRGAPNNALVTEIIRLRSIDAQSAVDTVRPLVSAQGSVTANRAGGSIVVVDFADNIRRVRTVLQRIDNDNAASRVVTVAQRRRARDRNRAPGAGRHRPGTGAGRGHHRGARGERQRHRAAGRRRDRISPRRYRRRPRRQGRRTAPRSRWCSWRTPTPSSYCPCCSSSSASRRSSRPHRSCRRRARRPSAAANRRTAPPSVKAPPTATSSSRRRSSRRAHPAPARRR